MSDIAVKRRPLGRRRQCHSSETHVDCQNTNGNLSEELMGSKYIVKGLSSLKWGELSRAIDKY
jgi:hypothetical protein